MKEDAQQKMDDVLKKWQAFVAALDVLYADRYVQAHGNVRTQEAIKRLTQPVSVGLGRLMATLKLPPPA